MTIQVKKVVIAIFGLGVIALLISFFVTLRLSDQPATPSPAVTSDSSPVPQQQPERKQFADFPKEAFIFCPPRVETFESFESAFATEEEVCRLQVSNATRIPQELTSLTGLRELQLDDGTFNSLPNDFGRLSNLVLLELRDNPNLSALPVSISQLSELKTLSVQGSDIHRFPAEFSIMQNVTILNVETGQFEDEDELRRLFPNASIFTSASRKPPYFVAE